MFTLIGAPLQRDPNNNHSNNNNHMRERVIGQTLAGGCPIVKLGALKQKEGQKKRKEMKEDIQKLYARKMS